MKRPILESESVLFICLAVGICFGLYAAVRDSEAKEKTKQEEIRAKAALEHHFFHKLSP